MKETYDDPFCRTVEQAESWAYGQPLDMKHEVLELLRLTLAESSGM